MIFAIDPGTTHSAFCLVDSESLIQRCGKIDNTAMLEEIALLSQWREKELSLYIEMVEGRGHGIGKTTLDTVVWIGRFIQFAAQMGMTLTPIPRSSVKSHFEVKRRTKKNQLPNADTQIKMILEKRFARHWRLKGNAHYFDTVQETRKVTADVWQAFALAVMMHDFQFDCWYRLQHEKRRNATPGIVLKQEGDDASE